MIDCDNCIHNLVCNREQHLKERCIFFEEPRPTWIPVTERLPDDGGVFLVTTVGKSFNGKNDIYIVEVMSLWHKDGHLEWRDNLVFESEWYNKKVVAWMPLPEPYKEGDPE